MTYEFDFDLTRISESFFKELAKFFDSREIYRKGKNIARKAVDSFGLQERTGIPVSDIVKVVNDMIEIYARNLTQEKEFKKANNKALFLLHCCTGEFEKKEGRKAR